MAPVQLSAKAEVVLEASGGELSHYHQPDQHSVWTTALSEGIALYNLLWLDIGYGRPLSEWTWTTTTRPTT